ncbi:MAG: PspA-associated protein PspAA [Dehalococcoidia bacterium]
MIVRILGEGQFRLDSDIAFALNAIDAALDIDLQQAHPAEFAAHLGDMQRLVRQHGVPLDDAELVPSDAVLPAEGSTLDEVRDFLKADGLVPG